MRGKRILKSTVLSLLLILLCGSVVLSSLTVGAAEKNNNISKNLTSHDIAIVFDNSGSMYGSKVGSTYKSTDRWSQALYAMEVFASMLNYKDEDGNTIDKLTIYPMSKIRIGKNGKSQSKIEITSKDEVKDIEKIYSPQTAWTILKPAYNAVSDLKKSKFDEKWLILLTDGDFVFNRSEKEKKLKDEGFTKKKIGYTWPSRWLEKKLKRDLNPSANGINFQYLGFEEASPISSNEAKGFYATNAASADQLTNELVKICNRIFKRDVLPISNNNEFNIDVSMSSIIAFVQKTNAEISLTDIGDNEKINGESTYLRSGTEGTGSSKYKKYAKDAEIFGQSVVFENCEAGSYKVSYPLGANIQVFYEPNVRIETTLTNNKEEKVDTSKTITPGKYKINYGLVDSVTGKDVSNSSLLSPINLQAEVKNGKEKKKIVSGDFVQLSPDSKTSVNVHGTFLGDYNINNKDDENAININVKLPAKKELSLNLSTEQSGKWFNTSDYDNWKDIRVDVTYGGKSISDKQLDEVSKTLKIIPESSKELSYTVEEIKGKSAFSIKLGQDPKTDRYKLVASAYIKDGFNQISKGDDSIRFEVRGYGQFWRWLKWFIIIGALLVLIGFILTRKAWPHKMIFVEKREDGTTRNKSLSIGQSMILVPIFSALSINAKKNSMLFRKFGKKANINVLSVKKPRSNVEAFYINYIPYERGSDFKDQMGNTFSGVIGNNTQIKIEYNDGRPELIGEIKVNNKR